MSCDLNSISCLQPDLITEPSQFTLPTMDLPELDLILIDGLHTFPVVFIDWYYTAEKLKVGGHLIVDNTNIYTGELLADFLSAESAWKQIVKGSNFSIFQKTSTEVNADWWLGQPYVVRRSRSKPKKGMRKHLRNIRYVMRSRGLYGVVSEAVKRLT